MLERWLHKRSVPVIHGSDLTKVLKDIGLYEKVKAGEVNCSLCDETISEENIEFMFMRDGKIQFCCSVNRCFDKLFSTAEEVQ